MIQYWAVGGRPMEWNLGSLGIEREVNHVLLFSKCLFEAFEIDRDRARQWHFLTLVIEKERDNLISLDDFSFEEISRIANSDGPLKSTYYWMRRLIGGFRNPAGAFLEPVISETEGKVRRRGTGQEKPRRFRLTPVFDTAARAYMRIFLSEMLPTQLNKVQMERVLAEQAGTLFRKVTLFLKQNYWPAWGHFVVPVLCGESGIDKRKLMTRSADWAILLITYKQSLRDPSPPHRGGDLFQDVATAMRGISKREFDDALQFLVRKQALRTMIIDGTKRYYFNREDVGLESSFSKYINRLSECRIELLLLIEPEIRAAIQV